MRHSWLTKFGVLCMNQLVNALRTVHGVGPVFSFSAQRDSTMELSWCAPWLYCRIYSLDLPTSSTITGIRDAARGRQPAAAKRSPLVRVYIDISLTCLGQAEQFRLRFERALRRLFRIYDVDRDGLLGDNELNAFQYTSFQVYLSEEITVLKKRSPLTASDEERTKNAIASFTRKPSDLVTLRLCLGLGGLVRGD